MATITTIQSKINKGLQKVGSITGQTYLVYRLNPKSTGSLVQPSNLIGTYKASFHRTHSRKNIEANVITKVPMFEAYVDPSQLKVGDLFVESANQKYQDGSAFTLAYFRPLRYNESQSIIFFQTAIPATLTRSEPNPAHVVSGAAPYQAMNKSKEQVLVLNNGAYSWSSNGMPTAVYLGLSATSSQGSMPRPELRLPTDVPRQTWDIYFPLLPGVQIFERDIVNAANGDRYAVSIPFVAYVGLQGWQIVAQKIRV